MSSIGSKDTIRSTSLSSLKLSCRADPKAYKYFTLCFSQMLMISFFYSFIKFILIFLHVDIIHFLTLILDDHDTTSIKLLKYKSKVLNVLQYGGSNHMLQWSELIVACKHQ